MSEPFTFEGIESGEGYDEFPIGEFDCVIENTETGVAGTGTPQLRVQFRVVTGEHKGRVTSDWLYFTQKAAGIVLTKITAAGVEAPRGLPNAEAYANKLGQTLMGHHATIVTRSETYEGVARTKVKAWKRAPEALQVAPANGASEMDEDIPF